MTDCHETTAAARREISEANVRAVLLTLGHDPERADWPRGLLHEDRPAWAVVDAVLVGLGHDKRTAGARRGLVGLHLETFAKAARVRAVA